MCEKLKAVIVVSLLMASVVSQTTIKFELTIMVQMFPKLLVSVTSRSNVKISLDLITFQTSIYPAGTSLLSAAKLRCPLELSLAALDFSQNMSDVGVSLLLVYAHALFEPEDAFVNIDPMLATRGVTLQEFSGKNTVTRCVLDIDVEILTGHRYYDVEIDLQVMRDTFLYREKVSLLTIVPSAQFCKREKDGHYDEEDRSISAGRGAASVCRLGFGCASRISVRITSMRRLSKYVQEECSFAIGQLKIVTYGKRRMISIHLTSLSSPRKHPHQDHDPQIHS